MVKDIWERKYISKKYVIFYGTIYSAKMAWPKKVPIA
jgi:hypothetical protein